MGALAPKASPQSPNKQSQGQTAGEKTNFFKGLQTGQFRTIGTGHCRDLHSPSPLIVRNLNETSWTRVEGHWGREEVPQATSQWPNPPPRGLSLLKGFRNIWLFQFNALLGKCKHHRKHKILEPVLLFSDRYLLFKFFLIKYFTSHLFSLLSCQGTCIISFWASSRSSEVILSLLNFR